MHYRGGVKPLQFLEKFVEGVTGIVGVAWCRRAGVNRGRGRRRTCAVGAIASDGYPLGEERAIVVFIFQGNAHGDGLHALKANGRLEMRTLFAAMQFGIALRTIA